MVNRTLKINQESYDGKIRTLSYDWGMLKNKRRAAEAESKKAKREREFLETLQEKHSKQVIGHSSCHISLSDKKKRASRI